MIHTADQISKRCIELLVTTPAPRSFRYTVTLFST